VDKVAPGAFGELLPALKHLSQNGRTRCVLGIRDVLDAPHVVQNEWRESGTEALVRQYYHAIWVYGDQRLYDPVDEYQWSPTITSAVRFTGYLDQSQRLCPPNPTQSEWISQLRRAYGSVFLCTLGGGKDGYAVADAFVEAMGGRTECGVLLTGPFIPRDRFDALRLKVDRHQNLRIVNFSNEADQLVSQADGVVGMAGYNTVSSILSYHKSALLVPRVVPREEQWIRAQRLARQGIVQMVHPNELEPAAIRNWVERTRLEGLRGAPRPDHQIDLGGLRRVVDYATALITNHRSCLVTPI
jgi:predicted glycosyltransferase